MTRRAVLALRVIPVQGKFDQRQSNKRMGLDVSFGKVFRRFLVIHKFVLNGASKINYFRSRRVRWFIREVTAITFSGRILQKRNSNLTTKNEDFSEKWSLQASCCFQAALPGAQHLERCFAQRIMILYDSQSLSCSKSNTGAGEI